MYELKRDMIGMIMDIHSAMLFQYIHPEDFHNMISINTEISYKFHVYILKNGSEIPSYIMFTFDNGYNKYKLCNSLRFIYKISPKYIIDAYQEYISSFDGCYERDENGRRYNSYYNLNTLLNYSQ